MNYREIYEKLIQSGIARGWTKKTAPCYVERHHIIPKSLGGSNLNSNLVFLTAREHFLAHRLLYLMHSGLQKSKMANAWFKMCQVNEFQERNISSKDYALARQAFSDYNPFKDPDVVSIVRHRMLTNNPMKDPKIAEKKSKSSKGTRTGKDNSFYGKTHSDESRKKIGIANTGPMNLSEQQRKEISDRHLDRNWYNNGVKNIKIKSTDERLSDTEWIPGRINNCNLGRPRK